MQDAHPSPSKPLAPAQAAALLGGTLTVLETAFAVWPTDLLTWRPEPGAWCLLEVVGHLVETEERGFGGRIRTILAEPQPHLRPWDPDAVARARRDAAREPSEVLAEFTGRRTANVALVAGLTAADLDRDGEHPEVGRLTVRDLLHEWVYHDASHLQQVLAIIQAYTWPAMGNAQRFSEPEGTPASGG